jgi:cholesterol transport system auxiliary component
MTMRIPASQHHRWLAVLACSVALTAGCGALHQTTTPNTSFYSLDGARGGPAPAAASSGPTLVVNPPHASAGFDSKRIIYTREDHKIEYFAHSEWVDTPARMLAPLILAATGDSGAFFASVLTPSAAAGDMRLDTEILRLQQEFEGGASQVRFSLRAWLVDSGTRKTLASREFEAVVRSGSNDTRGGVVAANAAVRSVLAELAAFCADAARKLPAPPAGDTKPVFPRP